MYAYNDSKEQLLQKIIPVMFDTTLYTKRVNQAEGEDLIVSSANNYYENVTEKEVDEFYNAMRDSNDNPRLLRTKQQVDQRRRKDIRKEMESRRHVFRSH